MDFLRVLELFSYIEWQQKGGKLGVGAGGYWRVVNAIIYF